MAHVEKNCITIFMTQNCNLNCKYCYCGEKPKDNTEINMDFVKIGIKDFFEANGQIHLRFFGNGEPTLEFEKMCEITNYCRDLSSHVTIELQTNGYFDNRIRDWVADNVDIIWISYDGLTDVNDYYRSTVKNTGVSDVVEKNIRFLAKRIDKLGIRTTIGQRNLYKQKEIIDKMENLYVKYIYSDLLFEPLGEDKLKEEIIDPTIYAKEYLAAFGYAETKHIFYGSFFTINFDKDVVYSCRACIPAPHLTPYGYVSACDMACSEEGCDELIYGIYDEKNRIIIYDENRIKNIRNRTVDNIDECKDCEMKYHCAGGCLGESLNEKGSIYKIKNQNCEAIKFLGRKLDLKNYCIPILHP